MRCLYVLAATAALLCGATQASAGSVMFDFEDGTDQGWGSAFGGDDASAMFSIVDIAGSLRMAIPNTSSFQEASHPSGADPFLAAFNSAVNNPSVYRLKYDWYIDTSLASNPGDFLELGTYINSGGGAYQQKEKEVVLDGAQLASGDVFSGHFEATFSANYGAIDPGFLGQTFQRLGLIVNTSADSDLTVYYDNIGISPEPTSVALLGIAATALGLAARRRRSF